MASIRGLTHFQLDLISNILFSESIHVGWRTVVDIVVNGRNHGPLPSEEDQHKVTYYVRAIQKLNASTSDDALRAARDMEWPPGDDYYRMRAELGWEVTNGYALDRSLRNLAWARRINAHRVVHNVSSLLDSNPPPVLDTIQDVEDRIAEMPWINDLDTLSRDDFNRAFEVLYHWMREQAGYDDARVIHANADRERRDAVRQQSEDWTTGAPGA